jgi:hypothetical protein
MAPSRLVQRLVYVLAVLAAAGAAAGVVVGGGPGRHETETARGAAVTLYGEGLYAADTWLIGAGTRGQDLALLLFEVPVLLLVLHRYRRGGPVAAAVLAGVLAFFTYFFVSLVFGTAQNRMFPVYVAAASAAGFALAAVVSRLDVAAVAAALPDRPGRRALATYLLAVAAALTLAWLPEMVATALSGDIAPAVGPYTSTVTEALDLGLVVPVALIAAVQLLRRRPVGRVLTLVMLVVNVCIGVLLIGQGVAQLVSGVPLTVGEIIAKMLTFATLTLVAGGLLATMARHRRRRSHRPDAVSVRASA